MTGQHPITPPPELVQQWAINATLSFPEDERIETDIVRDRMIAKIAAQWGADQELEACCEWFLLEGWHPDHPNKLRAARRPKPTSLKAQALQAAQRFYANGHGDCNDEEVKDDFDIICRALEQLDD